MIQQSHFWVYVQGKRNKYLEVICTSMFMVSLFTIAKIWKQPKCLSMDEWIKKLWSMYTMEYY